ITFTRVDLPAPFGPIRPTTSCRCSSSVTSCNAFTPSKDRDTEEARSDSPGLLSLSSASAVGGTLAPGLGELRDDLRRHRAHIGRLVVLDLDHAVLPAEDRMQLRREADLAAENRNLVELLKLRGER